MSKTEFIYFFIGVLSMFIGMFIYPHIQRLRMHIIQYFTRKKHKPTIDAAAVILLQQQIDELKEALQERDKNRRNNLRRDIRDYLKELQTK